MGQGVGSALQSIGSMRKQLPGNYLESNISRHFVNGNYYKIKSDIMTANYLAVPPRTALEGNVN